MIKFLFLAALRRFFRFRGYFAMNLTGLALGIASVWLVFLYAAHEKSYDRFIPDQDRIYRLTFERVTQNNVNQYCNVPMPVGTTMLHEYSEIESMVRLRGVNALNTHNSYIRVGDQTHFTEQIFFADSTFFDVFEFDFLQGDPQKSLSAPNTMVVSASFGERLFGVESPMGKVVRFQWGQQYYTATISGVMKDLPGPTHLPFEALVSWETQGFGNRYDNLFKGAHVYTYVRLRQSVLPTSLQVKFTGFIDKYMKELYEKEGTTCSFGLQPIRSIHLESDLTYEAYKNGSKSNVQIFSLLGLFLMLMAIINYINNSTATSLTRAREVAINKLHGAPGTLIMIQFLFESVLLSLIATFLAMVMVALVLPLFNQFTGSIHYLFSGQPTVFILILLVFSGFIGLLAGIIPAGFISRFKPLAVLKGTLRFTSKDGLPRKILVIFQLFISVGLLASTTLIVRQYRHAINLYPGFNKENLLVIEVKDSAISNHLPVVRERLERISGVSGVSATSNIPGATTGQALISSLKNDGTVSHVDCQFMWADYNFLDVMQIKLVTGRNFDRTFASDSSAIIVNQSAINKLGWEGNELECRVSWGEYTPGEPQFQTIGVIHDLLMGSIHAEVRALILFVADIPLSVKMYLLIRTEPEASGAVIPEVHRTLQSFSSDYQPEHHLMDDLISVQYAAEQKMMILFMILTGMNILIAILGLLALTSFTMFRRRKDLMTRKIWGASTIDNLLLVSREFLFLILTANLLAAPVVWIFMNKWLQNFVFRIEIDIWLFIMTLFASLFICFGTITTIIWRTVRKNPTAILRS